MADQNNFILKRIDNNTISQQSPDEIYFWQRAFVNGQAVIQIKNLYGEWRTYPVLHEGYIFETWAYLLERCEEQQ